MRTVTNEELQQLRKNRKRDNLKSWIKFLLVTVAIVACTAAAVLFYKQLAAMIMLLLGLVIFAIIGLLPLLVIILIIALGVWLGIACSRNQKKGGDQRNG